MYDKLVAKVNDIDTNDFVLKTKFKTDKSVWEKKIHDMTDFVLKSEIHWIRKQNSWY